MLSKALRPLAFVAVALSLSSPVLGSSITNLEPVVPTSVNENDLSILDLDPAVVLAWAGTPGSTSKRMLKRNTGVYSEANLNFQFPVVPLDHSALVSGVSCSGGSLTATLTSAAFNYASNQWAGASNIVFVTSVTGCGPDADNDYFHATSLTFSSTSLSFTAHGISSTLKDVGKNVKLNWGQVGTAQVKRAADKEHMFAAPTLQRRLDKSYTVSWSHFMQDTKGSDHSAPWEHAALLKKWGKEGGTPDDSYSKGEVANATGHHKRDSSETSLAVLEDRDLDYGLALYCVDCGFGGSAKLWGKLEGHFFPWPGLDTLQAGLDINMRAGLQLGMTAYVKYSQSYSETIDKQSLFGFGITGLITIGPYISVGVDASVDINATGQLLIGATVEWEDVSTTLDFLNPGSSVAPHGFTPVFHKVAQAQGELNIHAHVGLTLAVGIEASALFGLLTADAGVQLVPGVGADAKMEISANIGDDGKITVDPHGSCYGVAWNIYFDTKLQAYVKVNDAYEWGPQDLITPLNIPLAAGCIGFTKPEDLSKGNGGMDGGHAPEADDPAVSPTPPANDTSSANVASTATASPTPLPPAPTACNASALIVNSKPPTGALCKKFYTAPQVSSSFWISRTPNSDVKSCASSCLKNAKCLSFDLSSNLSCYLYNQNVTGLAITTKKPNSDGTFYDRACYQCPAPSPSPSASTTTSATPTATSAACATTVAVVNPNPPTGATCNKFYSTAAISSAFSLDRIGGAISDLKGCAALCLQNPQCQSWDLSSNNNCHIFSKSVLTLGITKKAGNSDGFFFDRACYRYPCAASSSTSSSTSSTKPTTTTKPSSTLATSTKSSSTSSKAAPTACSTAAIALVPKPPTGSTCNKFYPTVSTSSSVVISRTANSNLKTCASSCLKNATCLAFDLSSTNSCRLYNKAVSGLTITKVAGNSDGTFYDRACYACPS